MSPLERHDRVVLQFSGGKDSLACLYLLKAYWDKLTVVWVNTSATYPEVLLQMAKIKALVPHFEEVVTDAIQYTLDHGIPSDLVPEINTPLGHSVCQHDGPVIQSWRSCCNANLWQPLQEATQALGATLVIRGSRRDDAMVSAVRNGDVIDGVEYYLPLEDWSSDDVFDYLQQEGVEIPEFYRYSDTSLDCWHCTAFVEERRRELAHMKADCPEYWTVVRGLLEEIETAAENQLAPVRKLLRG